MLHPWGVWKLLCSQPSHFYCKKKSPISFLVGFYLYEMKVENGSINQVIHLPFIGYWYIFQCSSHRTMEKTYKRVKM